jgi:CHAT domain-containing protein
MLNSTTSFLYKFYSILFRITLLILAASIANIGTADIASSNSSDELNRISKYYYIGNTSRSIKEYELLLRKLKPTDTKYFRIILELANLYDKTNNINGLIRSVDKIHAELERTKLKSRVPHPWLYFGAREAQLRGNRKQAIKLLKFLLTHPIYSRPSEFNLFYLLKSNILLANIYLWEGDFREAIKYSNRLMILASSVNTLSPPQAFDCLKNYASLFLELGKVKIAQRIISGIKAEAHNLTGKSIDRFNWDLLNAGVQIELGEFENGHRIITQTEEYINPNMLLSPFQLLRKTLIKMVAGHTTGQEFYLENMIKDLKKADPNNSNLTFTNYIKKVYTVLSKSSKHSYTSTQLENTTFNPTGAILNKMILSQQKRRNGEIKVANELDLSALSEAINYLESGLTNKSTINLDILWSDKFILEKALFPALKNRSENTDELIFKALQLLNYSADNDGIITKHSQDHIRYSIEHSEIKSYERLFENKNQLINQAISRLVNIANLGKFYKAGDKLKSDSTLITQYSKYENTLDRLAQKGGTIGKSLIEKVSLPNLKSIQKTLREGEALYLPSFIDGRLFSGCLTNSSFDYRVQNISEKKIVKSIMRLLEYFQMPQNLPKEHENIFPAKEAYILYEKIFKSVPSCTNHTRLLIVPHPKLLAIPFNTLLLDNPSDSIAEDGYKSAPWFITKYSFSLFPSIKSYKVLRSLGHLSTPQKDFIGFGNPQFGIKSVNFMNIPENKLFLRGINNKNLFTDLPPLPDTEDELIKIKTLFPKDKSQIYLSEEATEKAVRTSGLENYRIINFATHALGKGNYEKINEPVLVLSPVDPNESFNDGILTASELARFDLNSDLVILSACNTSSSDGTPDGNSLSGFANSFFLAGTKALAVTQWPVFSNYAKELTTRLLRNSFSNQKTLSENLQMAMLDLIKNPLEGANSDPKFWGPFVIVGNGWQNLQEQTEPTKSRIKLKWSKNYGHTYDEGNSVFYDKESDSFYLSGISTSKSPHIKTKRVISYLKQIGRDGTILNSRDFIELSGKIVPQKNIDGDLIFLAQNYSESKFSAAELLLLDKNLKMKLSYKVETNIYDLPVGVIYDDKNYYLMTSHHDWRPNVEIRTPESLSILKLDNKLKLIRKINISPYIDKIKQQHPNIRLDGYSKPVIYQNKLVIAGNFYYWPRIKNISEAGGLFKNQENTTQEYYSILYFFDIDTLKLKKSIVFDHKIISGLSVSKNSFLFMVGNKTHKQALTPDIFVSRMESEGEVKEIFSYKSPLSQTSKDIYIHNGYVVVIGDNKVIFKVLQRESSLNPDGSMKDDYFDAVIKSSKSSEGFWINRENLNQGWIILLDQNGNFVEDKIIKDNSYSSLNSLDIDESGNAVATGLANGEQILELGFSLN